MAVPVALVEISGDRAACANIPPVQGAPLRLLVLGHGAERTGPPVYLLRLAEWFHESGTVDLEVVLLDDGPLLEPLRALAPVTVLPEWRLRGRRRYVTSIANRLGSERLAQRGREWALRPLARELRQPDIVYVNTAGSARALRYLPFRPKILVTHVHELSLGLDWYLRDEDRALIEQETTHYLTVSSPVRRHLVERWKIDPARIGHAAGVIDLPPPPQQRSVEEIRAEVGATPDDLVVGTAGTVDWRKAPDLFLALAQGVRRRLDRRVVFVWLGGGPSSPAWDAAHTDLVRAGLDGCVHFVGEQDAPLDWLAAFDLFVLPSREDAYPLVCLEAASLGIPTVCFATGGISDFVAPEGEAPAGAVVPYPDVGAFADAVSSLLLDEPERRRRGEEARRRVARDHSVEVAGPQLVADLYEVLERAA